MIDFKKYLNVHSPGYVVEIYRQGKVEEWVIGNKSVNPITEKTTSDTLYDIASLTKVFTAVLVYQAIEEKRLTLNTLVKRIEPRFTALDDVTILDLLAHRQNIWTKGYLGGVENAEAFYRVLYSAYVKEKTQTYVDAHYIILGVLLEKIYGKTLHELYQEKIFDVLKLERTTLDPDPEKCASNNFEHAGKGIIDTIPPGTVHDTKARIAKSLGIDCGHAGIFTTGKELMTFLSTFFDERLLKKETIEMMLDHDDIDALNKQILSEWSDRNELNAMAEDVLQKGIDVTLLRTHNHMGIRYRNAINCMNDVSDFAGKNAVTFSGYTGPMFTIDFDRKMIVLVMCNVIHETKLERKDRKRLTGEIVNAVFKAFSEELKDEN